MDIARTQALRSPTPSRESIDDRASSRPLVKSWSRRDDVWVKPLDEGQEREFRYLSQQRGGWLRLLALQRFLVAACVCVTAAVVAGAVAAAAGANWLLFAVAVAVVLAVVLALPVLAPERAVRLSVQATIPTEAAMKRGERNRSWPG